MPPNPAPERIKPNGYQPPWWLRGGHGQTLFAGLLRRVKPVPLTLEQLTLPDSDHLELAWGPPADGTVVVVLHGLGGCAQSPYVLGLLSALAAQGMQSVVMQFRGVGTQPNRRPRFFHAGETDDVEATIRHVRARTPGRKLAVVGFSMGGIMVLNWLGRFGLEADADMAVTVSSPMDLAASADYLASGVRRAYDLHLVHGLRGMIRRKAREQPLPLARGILRGVYSLRMFDDRITAPLHGFRDADDYYTRSSPLRSLATIRTPTRMIHALDDPFIPPWTLPTAEMLPPMVSLELSRGGGHVGFIQGGHPARAEFWLDQTITRMISAQLEEERGGEGKDNGQMEQPSPTPETPP